MRSRKRIEDVEGHQRTSENIRDISGRVEKHHTESSATCNIKTISTFAGSEGSESAETSDIFQPRAKVKVERRPSAERLHADRSDS